MHDDFLFENMMRTRTEIGSDKSSRGESVDDNKILKVMDVKVDHRTSHWGCGRSGSQTSGSHELRTSEESDWRVHVPV